MHRVSHIKHSVSVTFEDLSNMRRVHNLCDYLVSQLKNSSSLPCRSSCLSPLSLRLFLLFLDSLLLFAFVFKSSVFSLHVFLMGSGVVSETVHEEAIFTLFELFLTVDLDHSLVLKAGEEVGDEGVLLGVSKDSGVTEFLKCVSSEVLEEVFCHLSGCKFQGTSISLFFSSSMLKGSSLNFPSSSVPRSLQSLCLHQLTLLHL